MRSTKFVALTVLLLGVLTMRTNAQEAISSPFTVYSANPRYWSNNGTPVVILGAGQPLPGHKTTNYRANLDALAAHKVNYGRVWHLLVWSSTEAYFPWARSGSGTAIDGLAKFNLTHWDSNFWSRLKDACAYAQSKGIIMSIMMFDECGIEPPKSSTDRRWNYHPFNPNNNVNGLSLPTSGGAVPSFYSLSNAKLKSIQEQYVAKMIAETSGYPNVVYEICNEYTGPWDWEKYWIDFITARCSNMVTVNRLGSIPSDYWSDPNIDMVKFHYSTTSPGTINSNMVSQYSKNRAINYDETPESSSISYTNYRQMLWAAFVAGGHIHLESGYNEGAALDAVLHIRNFLNSNGVRFWEMAPNNSLVTSTPGGSAYTFAKVGSEYVTYIVGSGSGSMNISLQSGKSYTAKAYNPSNGTYTNLTVSGNTVSGIPSYSSDIAVYIKANTDPAPSTGTPNVALTLAVDRTSANPGDVLTYTITYRNTGDGEARSVQISNPVPQHTTYVSGGTYDSTSRTVRWTLASLAAGQSGTVSFKVKVE